MSIVQSSRYPVVNEIREIAKCFEQKRTEEGMGKFERILTLWKHNVFGKIWENNGRPDQYLYGETAFYARSFNAGTDLLALKDCASEVEKVLTDMDGAISQYGCRLDEDGDKIISNLIADLKSKDNPVLIDIRNELLRRVREIAHKFVLHPEFGRLMVCGGKISFPESPNFEVGVTHECIMNAKKSSALYKNVPEHLIYSVNLERTSQRERMEVYEKVAALAQEAIQKVDFEKEVFGMGRVIKISGQTKQLVLHQYFLELQGISAHISPPMRCSEMESIAGGVAGVALGGIVLTGAAAVAVAPYCYLALWVLMKSITR